MKEVLENQVNLIISYHPPIFAALKRVTQSSWKERLVALCLEHRVALYSPHTSYDAVNGGVNDWLASGLPDVRSVEPLTTTSSVAYLTPYSFHLQTYMDASEVELTKANLIAAGATVLGVFASTSQNHASGTIKLEYSCGKKGSAQRTHARHLPIIRASTLESTRVIYIKT